MLTDLDLNLLKVFDALLEEGSVTGAAARLHLSVPATSRALGRLRRAMDDPIFVRAGRGLAPTPFALRAATQVHAVLDVAQALLSSEHEFRPEKLERTFTLRANDGLTSTLAAGVTQRIGGEAPGVTVRFLPEGNEHVDALRDGTVDLEIGVFPPNPPDVHAEVLYEDSMVGFVAGDSPLRDRPTVAQLCRYPHISASRRGLAHGPLDDALAELGKQRQVGVVVSSFTVAALLATQGEHIALVPEYFARRYGPVLGARWFPLPVRLPRVAISHRWHARLELDPAQRWLREHVHAVAAEK